MRRIRTGIQAVKNNNFEFIYNKKYFLKIEFFKKIEEKM
jgi:hypothetical protein